MQHVFTLGWSGGAASGVTSRLEAEGGGEIAFDLGPTELPAGTVTDYLTQYGFDKDKLIAVEIIVTGNALAVVTMETNATDHAGGQIFTFPIGGGRILWDNTFPSEVTNPFSVDVTKMYWSKSLADTPSVKFRALFEA